MDSVCVFKAIDFCWIDHLNRIGLCVVGHEIKRISRGGKVNGAFNPCSAESCFVNPVLPAAFKGENDFTGVVAADAVYGSFVDGHQPILVNGERAVFESLSLFSGRQQSTNGDSHCAQSSGAEQNATAMNTHGAECIVFNRRRMQRYGRKR